MEKMYSVGRIVRPAILELLETGQTLQDYLTRRQIVFETLTSFDSE
ncbi:MAG: hypothetical protein LBV77_02290 [Candidatus Adiutrix intracellularis]|nr:hypothetical protein [Candidatus Adiutrix intracellularis]